MGFNPRSPRGGATIKFVKSSIVLILFQSTLPTRGSDFNFRSFFKPDYGFNPRSPRGGATTTSATSAVGISRFNPRSPRGGATCPRAGQPKGRRVSIHAPHEGERRMHVSQDWAKALVSIHAPHEGERPDTSTYAHGCVPFQSTLPTRGSDKSIYAETAKYAGFNPRSPRGGATGGSPWYSQLS